MGNCLQQPGQLRNRPHKSMRETTSQLKNFVYHDYSCYQDKVNRAAGLRAVVMVFATPLRQFNHDETNPAHLSAQRHLDTFIMTRKLSSIYQDYAKTHANPDTDGNFPYHRAVIVHSTHQNFRLNSQANG
jgi:hypothetical protein